MNRILTKRGLTELTALAAMAVLGATIALAQDQGAPQSQDQAAAQQGPRTDGQIEMDVVHALDASDALKNDLITAATIQGEVTLSGTVSSQASKQLAESIVSHVPGVTKVHNNLTIGNPGPQAESPLPSPDNGSDDVAQNEPQADSSTPGLPPPGPGPDQSQAPAPQQQPYPQGAYPPPPPPRPQYQYGQQYAPAPAAPPYQIPKGPVTVPQGTLVYLRTSEPVDSKKATNGQPVQFTVIQDVTVGGALAIPRGATVHGVVTEVKKVGSGDLAGHSELALELTSLDLGARNYPLTSDLFKVKGPNKGGETARNAVGGGILGTIIGCAVGRGAGCAIGAGAGVAAGTAASAASPGPRAWIPAEALVKFHITAPITVDPVSPQEAARLAEGLYPGGPNLYRRGGYYPYGSPYYGYAGYPYGPYGYPAPYYVPFYVSGGYYYWR